MIIMSIQCDLIAICERNLTPEVNDRKYLENYIIIRKDRKLELVKEKSAGGVILAIRNTFH